MKIKEQAEEYNPLPLILKLIPNKNQKPILLTNNLIKEIAGVLALGKIECDSQEEVVKCLELLKDMGLLTIVYNKGKEGYTLMIGSNYDET